MKIAPVTTSTRSPQESSVSIFPNEKMAMSALKEIIKDALEDLAYESSTEDVISTYQILFDNVDKDSKRFASADDDGKLDLALDGLNARNLCDLYSQVKCEAEQVIFTDSVREV